MLSRQLFSQYYLSEVELYLWWPYHDMSISYLTFTSYMWCGVMYVQWSGVVWYIWSGVEWYIWSGVEWSGAEQCVVCGVYMYAMCMFVVCMWCAWCGVYNVHGVG